MNYYTPDYAVNSSETFVQNDKYGARHIHLLKGESVPEHSAHAIETVVLLSGEIDFTGSGKTVRLKPGNFVVLEEGEPHSLVGIEESQVLVFLHK